MTENENEAGEARLISQACNGNHNAYGELVRLHYPGVIRVIYHLCGEMGLAEDMAQEAFLKAWLNLNNFCPESKFQNWLFRIAINSTLDVLRRKSPLVVAAESLEMLEDHDSRPEEIMIGKQLTEVLQEAIKSLPEAARSVLVLREYGELSYAEIATLLDIPTGTVMSRLHYARNRLRQIFKTSSLPMENYHA